MRGIHRSPVDCPQKGQWRGDLIFSLICAWTNSWATVETPVIWDAIALIMTSPENFTTQWKCFNNSLFHYEVLVLTQELSKTNEASCSLCDPLQRICITLIGPIMQAPEGINVTRDEFYRINRYRISKDTQGWALVLWFGTPRWCLCTLVNDSLTLYVVVHMCFKSLRQAMTLLKITTGMSCKLCYQNW